FTLFSEGGPVNSILVNLHILKEPFAFLNDIAATRGLVGLMNFVMWFGNTTLLLLAGMLGIDPSLYEAAEVDGATSTQKFFRITLPILKPILVYVVITSLIGGLQMFDVPSVLTNGKGNPMETSMTLIMYLNNHLYSKNFGLAGTVSVLLFLITGILSFIVFKVSNEKNVK
ncbi:MAG: sugar ABC transporter permease, partial [Alphaproteobacteria bacterium]|nr:sugar ABC transporter permease [Alphaproteobacteria bacterium]